MKAFFFQALDDKFTGTDLSIGPDKLWKTLVSDHSQFYSGPTSNPSFVGLGTGVVSRIYTKITAIDYAILTYWQGNDPHDRSKNKNKNNNNNNTTK